MTELTGLLASARSGDDVALARVFALLYDDLRRLARARLRQHQTFTLLDTTSLVHESYLKLVGLEALPVQDRRHFFSYAATVMRSVIVDFARTRASTRHGGDADHVVMNTNLPEPLGYPQDDVLRVHEALEALEQADSELARIVEMRFFGGLTEADIAEIMNISERTVRRHWEKAKLMLAATLV